MTPQRILLATDAWRPQVNGVVRTWETSIAKLRERGHTVAVLEPSLFTNIAAPFYHEIRLAIPNRRRIAQFVKDFQPSMIHIATEGPLGIAMRGLCVRKRWPFTTSYHSNFPEFLEHLIRVPTRLTYKFMKWFHSASACVFVSTPTLENNLRALGFGKMARWSRGVDLSLFYPRPKQPEYPRPIMVYAGRVSKEKNIEAFLQVNCPGTKVIVGDGPIRESLQKQFPDAKFVGYRRGAALAEAYANADVFVFPSKTDTFGLVMIEAMACGIPVAAYPVIGPIDVVTAPGVGALNDDLALAIKQALSTGDAIACVQHAAQFNWERCTDQLLQNFVPINTKSSQGDHSAA